jgi:hypothetical protein
MLGAAVPLTSEQAQNHTKARADAEATKRRGARGKEPMQWCSEPQRGLRRAQEWGGVVGEEEGGCGEEEGGDKRRRKKSRRTEKRRGASSMQHKEQPYDPK